MDNMYKLKQEKHDAIYSKIVKEKLGNVPSQAHPRVIITGGQGGSGKGTLANRAMKELEAFGAFSAWSFFQPFSFCA